MTQFSMVIGILFSNLAALAMENGKEWRSLFSVTAIVGGSCFVAGRGWVVESPRWLLSRDPSSRRARSIIKRLRGLRYDHEVEVEVEHILEASYRQATGGSSVRVLWEDRDLRGLMFTCCLLQMAQQFCGINAVFYYSTMFFEGVISNPLLGSVVVAAVNVLATYVALLLMDRCGRRPLILISCAGMAASVVVIVLGMKGAFGESSWASLAAVMR